MTEGEYTPETRRAEPNREPERAVAIRFVVIFVMAEGGNRKC